MSDFMTRVQELGRLFLRSAKEGGEAAAEAIEHRAQIQRLALQVRRLDKERSGLIRQIGAKVYSLHGQAKVRNQDVLVDCKRIDDIIVDIGKLQKDIELIRAASLEKGIEVPILAGIMPVTSLHGMRRMAALAGGARYPAKLIRALKRANSNPEAVKRIGIHYAAEQCANLLNENADGIHFYTLNKSRATREIYHNLGLGENASLNACRAVLTDMSPRPA